MPPNILLITADEWRGDCLGIAGHPVVKTPNIDRLASSGTYFARHYVQAAPCGPSRASLYTGLYQMNHRVVRNGTPLDARFDNIARAMRRLGYEPTLFGYTDTAVDPRTVPPDSPWLRTYEGVLPGFDVAVLLPNDLGAWLDWLEGRGFARPADFWDIYLPVSGRTDRPSNAPPRYGAEETETAFLTDMFLTWLAARPSGQPWFAHISYLRPHPPFIVPEPYNRLYDPVGGPPFRRAVNAKEERCQHPLIAYWHDQTRTDSHFLGSIPTRNGEPVRIAEWSDEDFRIVRAVYWGMVNEVDHQLGRVIDAVAGTDTVIVLTSDHGEMLGDHWTLGKFGYFDQSFHVPLIVNDLRRRNAQKVDTFTESVDLMPTIVELAGGTPPPYLDGRSLIPLLEGGSTRGWRDAVHWEFDFREVFSGIAQTVFGLDLDSCSLAVHRDERFKYVNFAGLPPLLFDLVADPDELVNLAGDPAYQAVRVEYAEKLLAWRARHLDRTFTGIMLTEDGLIDGRARPGR